MQASNREGECLIRQGIDWVDLLYVFADTAALLGYAGLQVFDVGSLLLQCLMSGSHLVLVFSLQSFAPMQEIPSRSESNMLSLLPLPEST